jgi:hypothetical protein
MGLTPRRYLCRPEVAHRALLLANSLSMEAPARVRSMAGVRALLEAAFGDRVRLP